MQYRPTAHELLSDIADALERDVLPATSEGERHTVRVAAHLARLVAREVELGDDARLAEQAALGALMGAPDASLTDQQATLSRRLRASTSDDFDRSAWSVLVDVARRDLQIAKPGHDRWEHG